MTHKTTCPTFPPDWAEKILVNPRRSYISNTQRTWLVHLLESSDLLTTMGSYAKDLEKGKYLSRFWRDNFLEALQQAKPSKWSRIRPRKPFRVPVFKLLPQNPQIDEIADLLAEMNISCLLNVSPKGTVEVWIMPQNVIPVKDKLKSLDMKDTYSIRTLDEDIELQAHCILEC